MMLITVHCSAVRCYLVPLMIKYLPRRPFLSTYDIPLMLVFNAHDNSNCSIYCPFDFSPSLVSFIYYFSLFI
jgi:hypothetical protein